MGEAYWPKDGKNDRIKVSLSLKVVNQGTGKDLDPNKVITRKKRGRGCPSRITLDRSPFEFVPEHYLQEVWL